MSNPSDGTDVTAGAAGPRRASVRLLLAGLVTAVVAGLGILLVAGTGGAAGVLVAALVEAGFVYLLYRWSPAP